MSTLKKKHIFRNFCNRLRKNRLNRIKTRLNWKKKELAIKSEVQDTSHSLLWVWEFSKKAVLICFIFYIAVQLYSMIVMVITCDYSHLGELITQAGEIVRDCVFGYFVKAGIENALKIICSTDSDNEVEADG